MEPLGIHQTQKAELCRQPQTSESEQTHGENLPAPNVLKPRALVEPRTTPKSNALLHVVGSLGTSCREALLAWCEL